MKPRIGWFYQDLNPGGGQRVCREISRRLARRGNEVTVVVPSGRARGAKIEGVKIIESGPRIANPAASIIASLPFMLADIGRQDVIISSMPLMAFVNAARIDARLHCHWIHSDDLNLFDDRALIRYRWALELYKISVRASFRLPLKFWCNSRWTRERFQLNSPQPAEIVTPGVDQNIFKPIQRAGDRLPLIGVMGRRVKMKGTAEALEALNIIFGKGFQFILRVFTQEKLSLEKAEFPLEIVSPPDDRALADMLAECSLFVSASWHEGFYLPALEAMACGVPVVTTDSGGVREYAVEGKNCLMTPPKNPRKLAEAVEKMLLNSELSFKLAEEGIRTASKFSWDSSVDKIENIIFASLEKR